jgi:hypothetical protein
MHFWLITKALVSIWKYTCSLFLDLLLVPAVPVPPDTWLLPIRKLWDCADLIRMKYVLTPLENCQNKSVILLFFRYKCTQEVDFLKFISKPFC